MCVWTRTLWSGNGPWLAVGQCINKANWSLRASERHLSSISPRPYSSGKTFSSCLSLFSLAHTHTLWKKSVIRPELCSTMFECAIIEYVPRCLRVCDWLLILKCLVRHTSTVGLTFKFNQKICVCVRHTTAMGDTNTHWFSLLIWLYIVTNRHSVYIFVCLLSS